VVNRPFGKKRHVISWQHDDALLQSAFTAGVNLGRRCEEPQAVPHFDDITVADFLVRTPGHYLEKITVRPDGRRRKLTQLLAGHLRHRNGEMGPVDLDLEFWGLVPRSGLFVFSHWKTSGFVVDWYHDTTVTWC
jgi:hypothetical protein